MTRLQINVIIVFGAFVVLTLFIRSYRKQREELSIMTENYSTLIQRAEYYQTKDSLSAAGVNRLILRERELKEYNQELSNTIRSLNIKLIRVQSASRTSVESTYNIRAPTVDTIVISDRRIDSASVIRYSDEYIRVSGIVANGVFSGNIKTYDTIVQVVHRIPHKWWFFRWGTKSIRQEVVSKNPHSEIKFTEYIELR